MEIITLKGNLAEAVSPEGQKAQMNIEDLIKKVAPRRMDTNGIILPDGLKAVLSQGPMTIWVHQTPPRVWQFKWIAPDSPARYGRGTKYRTIKIALPYLVVIAVFAPGENNQLQLSQFNECFFRTHPLEGLDDELLYPALLNCSKFHVQEGNPLSWICTQHMDRKQFINEKDSNKRMRLSFRILLNCLLETGFNYSSEHHEQTSWFSESAGVDPRVATVEKWQEATEADPLFVLEVPWLKTGHTVQKACDRIFQHKGALKPSYTTASDIARVVFNHQQK